MDPDVINVFGRELAIHISPTGQIDLGIRRNREGSGIIHARTDIDFIWVETGLFRSHLLFFGLDGVTEDMDGRVRIAIVFDNIVARVL